MKLFRRPNHHHLNLLSNNVGQRRRRVRQTLTVSVTVLGILIVASLLFGLPAYRSLAAGKEFKRRLVKSQQLMAARRFTESTAELERAAQSLGDAERAYRPLLFWRWAPILGRNIRAGNGLLEAARVVLRAGEQLNGFVDQLLSPLAQRKGGLTFASLSVTEREQLLKRLGDAEPTLLSLEADLREIIYRLDTLPRSYVQRKVVHELEPVREGLTLGEEGLRRAAPIARVLPKLLGHLKPQTYLFLLQNNSELRPTGGFIGTYGVIKVRNGEITSFTTENSYNLDDRVKGKLFIPPPLPLRLYNSADAFFFRDSNWSPDFRNASAKALSLYSLEGGREKFDGVLAVTPTFIESLLRLTGPITVDHTTFTADNLRDTLQDQVTYSYAQRGVGQTQRKEVIGKMGAALMAKLFALPQQQWRDLWQVLLQNLIEKQMLLNFVDPDLQSFAVNQGWGGAVETPAGDQLLVVDANLASLKTDPVVKRTIDYSLDATGEQLKTTAKITYLHTGTFTQKTTRYRTYVRLYVPKGATLVSSEGADATDRSNRPGKVTVEDDLDHTTFGAFKSIEPGTTESFSVTYTLPTSIADSVAKGTYTLLVQKQPGTIAHALSVSLRFSQPARFTAGIDNPSTDSHTTLSIQSDLRQDRNLAISINH